MDVSRVPMRDASTQAVDASLVARAQAGDRRAFEVLLGERLEKSLRTAFAILGVEADARDATRAAFAGAWREIRRLHEPSRFDAWLTRLLVRRCHGARSGRRRMVVREIRVRAGDPVDGPESAAPAAVRRPGGVPASSTTLDAIEQAFARLGPGERTLLVLRHLERRSLAEISDVLRMPLGTARSRLSGARDHLDRAAAREGPLAGKAPLARVTPLADSAVEAALARLAGRIRVDGLGGEIMAEVAGTLQLRRPLIRWPDSLVPRRPVLRPTWVLTTTGLLVGILAVMVLARAWLVLVPHVPRHPADLVATGIETLGAEGTAFTQAVADSSGAVWAYGAGVLVRLDPASGVGRTWTVSDDAAFGPGIIAPAADGGVWMTAADGRIRWFDGERFRDVVPGPPGVVAGIAEAPDRLLWVATDAGVFAWDGSSWLAPPPGRPTAGASSVAVDATGDVWVGNVGEPDPDSGTSWVGNLGKPDPGSSSFPGAGVSRFDGTAWENHDWVGPHRLFLHGRTRAIVPAPNELVWVATELGLGFFNGLGWTTVDTADLGFIATADVTTLADGTTFAVGIARSGGVAVARLDGRGWTRFGPADGLPATGEVVAAEAGNGATDAGIASVGDGVVVATAAGLFRPGNQAWARAWPANLAPVAVGDLLAAGAHDVWAMDGTRFYRWSGGSWTVQRSVEPVLGSGLSGLGAVSGAGSAATLARTADGTLVALTAAGIEARRDGRWETLRPGSFGAMAVDASGTVWAISEDLWGPATLRSFTVATPDEEHDVLRIDATAVVRGALAVARDGSVWAAMATAYGGWFGRTAGESGLMRYHDGAWELLDDPAAARSSATGPVTDPAPDGAGWGSQVIDVAAAPNGDVWAVWAPTVSGWTGTVLSPGHVSRFDGATWRTYRGADGLPEFTRGAIGIGPEGSTWLATDVGIAHFDGARWTTLHEEMAFGPAIAVAPDGAALVAGPSGVQRVVAPASPAVPAAGPTPAPPSPAATPGPTPTPEPAVPGPDLPRRPVALVPTGFTTVTSQGREFTQLVADGVGFVWGLDDGILLRLDPVSGAGRTWTYADDAVFGSPISVVAPARGGGVWLAGADATIRWFDGEGFRDTMPEPPAGVELLAEAPDGTLWASSAGELVRWDGSEWRAGPSGGPEGSISALAVDGAGGVWVATGVPAADPDVGAWRATGVARYDGSGWVTHANQALGFGADERVTSIAAAGGSVWVFGSTWGSGVAVRFDGRAWHDPGSLSVLPAAGSLEPDGDAWVVGRSGETSVTVGRYDGRSWRRFLLPEAGPEPIGVAATSGGAFVGTRGGIYAFRDDAWVLAWPPLHGMPGDVACCTEPAARLLAVSGNEVWTPAGTWRSRAGRWMADAMGVAGVLDLARTADGTLVAATTEGVAARRDGAWSLRWMGNAQGIAVAGDGTVWFGDNTYPTRLGRIRGLRLDDPTFAALLPPTPDAALAYITSVASGIDGSLWVGMSEFRPGSDDGGDAAAALRGGLLRFRDGAWERLSVVPAPALSRRRVANIAVAPNGDVWVAWDGRPGDGGRLVEAAIGRFDGRAWTVFGAADGLPDRLTVAGVAAAPDGVVWLATDRGLARFDGRRWAVRYPGVFGPSLSIAADGTLFVAGPSGIQRLPGS
jgi:RNA polymerase sigma-70 factor (ECF subfamily)